MLGTPPYGFISRKIWVDENIWKTLHKEVAIMRKIPKTLRTYHLYTWFLL